jgi:hypothetical protein
LKKSHREKAESTRAHKSKPIVTRSVENLDLNQISLRAMHIPFRGAEGLKRGNGGAGRLILHTGCAGGPAYQRREGHGARRKHAKACRIVAQRADSRRGRLSCGIS